MLVAIKMKNIDLNRVKFYQFLNDNISKKSFENWIYESKELENILPEISYVNLLSFNFRSRETKKFIKSIVKKHFDWKEFEKWRTIELLKKIKNGEIEIVLATRKLMQLYYNQKEEIKRSFVSIYLAIGYESELDDCPIEAEYSQWNSTALKKQLEKVESYKASILDDIDKELNELLNPELKVIDLGKIVNIKHLHEIFADRLYFSDFYGNNWDAFWDSINENDEMPENLTLANWDEFEKTFKEDSKILKQIIVDYNYKNAKKKIEIVGNNG